MIGNPPYVRQELIPAALLAEYRRRYSTLYDRADLYIPFIERSLTSLAPAGCLASSAPIIAGWTGAARELRSWIYGGGKALPGQLSRC
ncbi:hypothetical protein B2A_09945 [mine drainage metagenome]|uniref:Type II methyltransferase M.TaqI-like domain-containing protein n=1 Tax=mine drainage metagenome TaxID=410659 RepID=T0Z5J5_9ZZZZ